MNLYSSGRKVAIDASMSLYQFLIAVRTGEGVLTSSDGDTTRYIEAQCSLMEPVYDEMHSCMCGI